MTFLQAQKMLYVPLWDEVECIWPNTLCPAGQDTYGKESFQSWWSKHESVLGNVDKLIAEQWVYRHWNKSPFSFLPLDSLTWEARACYSKEFLYDVHLLFGGPADADWDYRVFHEQQLQTANDWSNGTWSIPPVVLETPCGFQCKTGRFPDARLLLVEGSKRYRYLNALYRRGERSSPHKYYLIRSPLCNKPPT